MLGVVSASDLWSCPPDTHFHIKITPKATKQKLFTLLKLTMWVGGLNSTLAAALQNQQLSHYPEFLLQ